MQIKLNGLSGYFYMNSEAKNNFSPQKNTQKVKSENKYEYNK